MALRYRKDGPGTIAEYREAVRPNPGSPSYHHGLGSLLYRKGDKQAALVELQKALELYPNNPNYKAAVEKVQSELKQ